MSGGVDSSVTARILADKVRSYELDGDIIILIRIRIMIYLQFSCVIGTLVMSREQIEVASGRKTGKTFNGSAKSLIFPVKWSVDSTFVSFALTT